MIVLLIIVFFIIFYISKLLMDKVYENKCLVEKIGNLCYYSLRIYLLLLTVYLGVNFDDFVCNENNHIIMLAFTFFTNTILFEAEIKESLKKIFKIRTNFVLPYWFLSFLNSTLLNLDFNEILVPIDSIDEPDFDKAAVNVFIYSFIYFFDLPGLLQFLFIFPFSIGNYKLMCLPKVQKGLLLMLETREGELASLGFDKIFKELIINFKPANTTVDVLTQRTAIATGEKVGGKAFNKNFLENCYNFKIITMEQDGYYKVKNKSFNPIFSLSNEERITGLNTDHPYFKNFSSEEINNQIVKIKTAQSKMGPTEYQKSIRQTSQMRDNKELIIHLERAEIQEPKEKIIPKVQGFFNVLICNGYIKQEVNAVLTDNALGSGRINSPGFANATPLAFSALDSVEIVNKTFLKGAKIIGGGNIYKGDVYISYEGKKIHMEIKDISVDLINNEHAYSESLEAKIEDSKAEYIMLKAPYVLKHTQLLQIVRFIATHHQEKTFFLLTSEKIIKINYLEYDEKELPL